MTLGVKGDKGEVGLPGEPGTTGEIFITDTFDRWGFHLFENYFFSKQIFGDKLIQQFV